MRGYWSTLLFMVLTFLGTFYMQTFLNEVWELNFLFLGIVFAFMVLLGIAMEKPWANALRTIFFAAAIGNLALIFHNTRTGHFVFSALLLVNIVGLISSILDEPDEFEFAVDDSVPELLKVELLPLPPKRKTSKTASKRKAKKKKAVKKSSTKRKK